MITKDKLIEWVESVLQYGKSIIGRPSTIPFSVPEYMSFRDRSLRFLRSAFGNESHECEQFESSVSSPTPHYVEMGCEFLVGIKEDIQNDRVSIIGLLSAAIFSDMLKMAEHLYDNDFFPAASVLAGGVLEEHLRQLSLKKGIPVNFTKANGNDAPRSASDLNNALRTANMYDETERSNVDSLYKVRNKGAHPPNNVAKEEAKRLLLGVADFVNKYRL